MNENERILILEAALGLLIAQVKLGGSPEDLSETADRCHRILNGGEDLAEHAKTNLREALKTKADLN